ncbi:UDP-N-acetylglucosamine 2-epimerase (non-hydrolyzing), partial [bacterium]|nr:UDP-N-acetylglucosamine 2-epimerase (non-hydrolyzing) [bacterium]
MKVISIIGARPQFIKAAPVSCQLRKNHTEVIVHTGQHYDDEMSKVFFEELGLPRPDYNLGIGSVSHGRQTGRMLKEIEKVLLCESPDMVLVYGDTNSTLAGALAAAKLNIPAGHVEAGLRSFDRRMPEEINRILSDCISSMLFAPTKTAVDNLKREGIVEGVYLTGDVMYDAVLRNVERAREKSDILSRLR